MERIAVARKRLEQASRLPAVLDAAYDAFEGILSVIEDLQESGGGAFAAYMMSGVSAASGRDALAAAPSLPRPSLHGLESPEATIPVDAGRLAPGRPSTYAMAGDASVGLTGLSDLLVGRLTDAEEIAADAGDQIACREAVRCAIEICSLLGGARADDR